MQYANKIYNIENVTNAVFNILGKSVEHKKLVDEIEELEKDVLYIVDIQRKLEKSKKLNEAKNQLEQFKIDVIRLAEAFTKTKINTERIQIAKEQFENGAFFEANANLTEADLKNNQKLLLQKKSEDQNELSRQLQINAEEWLMKARLTALNYGLIDRFAAAKRYFECALLSYQDANNLLEYAVFLEENLQYTDAHTAINKAQAFDDKYILKIDSIDSQIIRTRIYYLKGRLECALEVYSEAISSYEKSLALNQKLLELIPQDAKKLRIKILNGFCALYFKTKNYKLSITYASEAMTIYEEMKNSSNEMKVEYAKAAKFVGLSIGKKGKIEGWSWFKKFRSNNTIVNFMDKSIAIFNELALLNPDKYLTEVIEGLEYKGRYARIKGNISEAQTTFIKAIELSREQSVKNPKIYLPLLSWSLQVYGELLNNTLGKYREASKCAEESLQITEELSKDNPEAYLYALATNQKNFAVTLESLGELDKAWSYHKKSNENFKTLRSKNPKLYS